MASLQTTCPFCGKITWLHYKNFNRFIELYNCETVEELAEKYPCRSCRKLTKPNNFYQLPEYRNLCILLQTVYNDAIKRGINDMTVRNDFLKNINQILDKRFIKRYSYQVKNNMLIGLVLEDVIFFGKIYIPLFNKKH